jgi:hypothetical protein
MLKEVFLNLHFSHIIFVKINTLGNIGQENHVARKESVLNACNILIEISEGKRRLERHRY